MMSHCHRSALEQPRPAARACRFAVALWALAGAATLCLVGCGPRGPAVQFVQGRVLVDGEPLADASVGFNPVGAAGLAAYGATDSSGTYRLTTTQGGRKEAGAPIGDYIVTVTKFQTILQVLGPSPDGNADPEGFAKYNAAAYALSEKPPKPLIPEGYGDIGVSPLRATVVKGRNIGPTFTFELSKSFKAAGAGKANAAPTARRAQ